MGKKVTITGIDAVRKRAKAEIPRIVREAVRHMMDGGWISVKDRLPTEHGAPCWICTKYYEVDMARFCLTPPSEWVEFDWRGVISGVTHWMPLVKPEPPA